MYTCMLPGMTGKSSEETQPPNQHSTLDQWSLLQAMNVNEMVQFRTMYLFIFESMTKTLCKKVKVK